MLPSAGAALLHRPVQRWRGNPVDTALLFHDGVMDDEDDRRLLDFIGDVQALNEYLHGSNSKCIGEDDVTNAAFGSASSFFTSDTGGSNEGLKDDHNHLGEFGEVGGTELQLSSSLPFIEDDLDSGTSQDEVDLGGEDQPFDILQKSLLEADITEQTLAQEALLDSQPSLIPTASAFPQQLVSGGFEGIPGPGVVAPLAQPQAFIQQVPQLPLPNGPAGHIQVVGSFNGSASSMMTINSLEQPQILLRQSGNVVTNNSGQGTMFTPSAAGQVSMSFNKGTIPVQNIIIQRGPMQQTLIRPIQPKPLQTGGQTVYSISNIGLQPSTTTTANIVSNPYTASGSPQSAQQVKVVNPASSIVMHSPLGQQAQPQSQSNLPQGQFLLPTSISLTPGTTVHGFQAVNGQVYCTVFTRKCNQNAIAFCLIGFMFVMFRYIALSDGFLEDFCCGPKLKIRSTEVLTPATHEGNPSVMETSPRHSISHTGRDGQGMNSHTEPAYRTEPQQQGMEEHRRTPIKCILDLKKKKFNNLISSNSQHAHYPTSPSQSQHSSAQGYPSNLGQGHEHQLPSDHSHTPLADSVLEAAVNSILEC
ncbi:GLTSCR1-like protein [Sinocyclocheilus rhinocerous]|uniref:GLTSCR1-like protein n=1 Tax=Sinocyclocheilus rhinocerous TaxID=307959 RepID=UPI0007B7DF34|nr:PREDICTED: GLTSCR1-like protein [Sinocyclocheilus rhinocerous]